MRTKRIKKGARLGQHFLTGQWAARKLVEAARIRPNDTVLEIGPGKGALTGELLATGARIVAIEKDETLAEGLRSLFPSEIENAQLTVIPGDVRDLDLKATRLGTYVLAANIPYYITGEIIRQFLSADQQPRTMALLVQKEVANRILARDGKESILSISVKAYGKPEIAAKVARGNFNPPPSVDSAILVVNDISKDLFKGPDEKFFFEVVRAGFSSKRKFLLNNLAKKFGRDAVSSTLTTAGLPEKVRAENVSLGQWTKIAKVLAPYG
ncbi:MAG TPA: 16S rRNA (adenine(1518)-N(6)/adenine(1519)-N(6))-dimethyltransferase RsmA [Candidatus Paceibacterota bacterium]|jgi:16S rRNA (adenine1518-N6/adenine1519-N6)-dimethyltransferase|nr:16S rRNA (adenine(1518)-N(6)/adenine(1519)-N(6))-dimethyltransferase RsmA [Candidatus Paceibacterota bacterium]